MAAAIVAACLDISVAQNANVKYAERVSTSVPLRSMPPQARGPARAPFAVANKFWKPDVREPLSDQPGFVDPSLQQAEGSLAPTVGVNFDGLSEDDNAAVLGYRVVPPDVSGDVGPNHYVQWINSTVEIYDKSGSSMWGPFAGNVFFAGMGGACETRNDGDPIVLYDEAADRWLVSQFTSAAPYFECVAVSTSPDPLGSYYRYAFPFGSDFPDYPKLGVWSDSYLMTLRMFLSGSFFGGIRAVAVDRNAMLNGQAAAMVEFTVPGGTSNDGWLPADADDQPPANTPGIFAGSPDTPGSNEILLYALDVDWNNPGAATFTQIADLSTSPIDLSISRVSQPSPGENLDVPGLLPHAPNAVPQFRDARYACHEPHR